MLNYKMDFSFCACKCACFPAHIAIPRDAPVSPRTYITNEQVTVIRVSPGIMFPHHCCADLQREARWPAILLYVSIANVRYACMPICS